MPKWSFSTPYRLRDSRVACGIQFSFKCNDFVLVVKKTPLLWAEILKWKHSLKFPFDDCSIELSCLCGKKEKKKDICLGLFIRPAFPSDLTGNEAIEGAKQLKFLCSTWLNSNGFTFSDAEDEFSPLALYPIWDNNISTYMDICCFSKKSEKVVTSKGSLIWFPEIDNNLSLECVFDLQNMPALSGLSFEIHSLSHDLCKKAANYTVDGSCGSWIEKIKNQRAVFSRMIVWGDRGYIREITNTICVAENIERKNLNFSINLLYYLVYDPWACEEQLPNQTSKLGSGRYILTYDELQRLFSNSIETETPQSPLQIFEKQALVNSQSTSETADTLTPSTIKSYIQSVVKDSILPDMQSFMTQQVDKLRSETRNQWEKMQIQFAENTQEFARIAEKIDNISELAEKFDDLAPEGFKNEFSVDELNWLGVHEEKELIEIRKIDNETVHLMRTAFSLARAGMQADESKDAIMPFFIPLGSLFEHLMRKYFQPSLFNHTPLKAEIDAKATASPYQRNVEIQASDFDRISDAQIESYVTHALIGGNTHSDFYWRSWLNIFKPVRIARNKVHTTRGLVRISQLKCVYNLMLMPGVDTKISALKYAFEHSDEDRERLFLAGMNFSTFQNEMRKNAISYTPSMIDFLLMCRDAKWV